MNGFLDQVSDFIRHGTLLRRRQRVLVGVSGGLDSMVLLEVLSRLASAPENQWSLVVGHFNHGLRGRSSQADQQFVRARAQRLGLPCEVGQGTVKLQAREQGVSVEMMARGLRHQFLAQTARRLRCTALTLAHHADDQLELFWLRLLRGASPEGLAGMRAAANSPVDPRVRLVRPLLKQWRAELEQFAAQENISFREDTSNQDTSILRNRIRHRLLPLLLKEYQPGLRQVLQRQMELLAAESDFVGDQTDRWSSTRPRPAFAQLPTAVQRRALVGEITALGLNPEFDLIEHLRSNPNSPIMVAPARALQRDPAGRVRFVECRSLAFREGENYVDLGRSGAVELGDVRIRWHLRQQMPRKLQPKPGVEWFDAERVGRIACLRHWRRGDRFEPCGLGVAAKLQDLLTNLKVPAAKRRELYLGTTLSGEIWWVQGVRIGEQFKLKQTTNRVLEWRWEVASRS